MRLGRHDLGEKRLLYVASVRGAHTYTHTYTCALVGMMDVAIGLHTCLHAGIVPQVAIAFEQLLLDAGAPQGVYTNLLISHDQSDRVVDDPRIKGVALTGSVAAGRSIAARAGKNTKSSSFTNAKIRNAENRSPTLPPRVGGIRSKSLLTPLVITISVSLGKKFAES